MPHFMSQLFSTSGFMPHGMCFLWRPEILILHVLADAVIVLSYFSIPFFLFTLARKRKDLIYRWVLDMFAAFILFCGLTHAFDIWTIWNPDYLIEGFAKLATAIISATTAIVLWPLLPKILAIPSPIQLRHANLRLEREVNEREQVTEERERSQRFLQTVLENAQDGIVACDAQGTLTLFNRASRAFHGIPEEPLPPERWAEHYHLYLADGKTPMKKEDIPLYRALQGELVRNVEMVIKPKTGRQRTLLASGQAMFDAQGAKLGAVITMHDITERKQAEQQLQLWGKVVEVSSNGVLITDPNQPSNPIISVNPAFERVTGYTAKEILGGNCRFLQGDDRDQPALDRLRRAIREQRDCQVVLRNYRKDGSLFWNELFIAPLRNDHGQVTHFIGIQNDITEYKTYEAQLEHQANHDALTQLPNRTLLQDRLQHALVQAHRAGRRVAVLFIDLDRFKSVNDSLGHAGGDILLKTMAERLKACVREGDTVARQGGDEFVVVLPEDQPQDNLADTVAHRILNTLALPFTVEGQEFFISGSIGISLYPEDGQDTGTLLKHADIAMYRAKELGRNTVQFYAQEMNAQVMERLVMGNDLRHALEREELKLYYQPQVELKTGQVIGVEALLRWDHPQRGMISPAEFIPLAEETDLIIPIGEWVLKTACAQVKTWREAGLSPLTVGVNLSARQFIQLGLTDTIAQILQETDLEAACLELEITETLLMKDMEGAILTLQALKDMGMQLAIDDFGTGYSSLNYLKRFPIDRLKIDKSFVQDITTDPDDAAITQAIISMAHNMTLKVIAEGVETEEQLAFLRSQHCDEWQGYYFSRPLPAGEIAELLRENRLLRVAPDNCENTR